MMQPKARTSIWILNKKMADNDREKRHIPFSELDFNLMTTDSVWGDQYINNDLKEKLQVHYKEAGMEGDKITKESLWGLLSYYTRDMRLANLSYKEGEITYCQHYLDLGGDFLQVDQIKPFVICLQRVATLLELSQSKGGFLRKRMHTFTQENYKEEREPKKKTLFGKNK